MNLNRWRALVSALGELVCGVLRQPIARLRCAVQGRVAGPEQGSGPRVEPACNQAESLAFPSGAWLDRCSGAHRLTHGR